MTDEQKSWRIITAGIPWIMLPAFTAKNNEDPTERSVLNFIPAPSRDGLHIRASRLLCRVWVRHIWSPSGATDAKSMIPISCQCRSTLADRAIYQPAGREWFLIVFERIRGLCLLREKDFDWLRLIVCGRWMRIWTGWCYYNVARYDFESQFSKY